jgi:hypothetical protein
MITISWTPSKNNGGTPLTQYKVYWSQNYYNSPVFSGSIDSTVSVTTANGLITGDLYSFYVITCNQIGDSAPSGILSSIAAGSKPSQPINFKRAVTVTPVDNKISI